MTRDERHATNAQDECGRTDAPNPLEAFSPLTQAWFRDAFAAPTRAQAEAWRSIASGQNCLVVAPTGSGKTLAAFLWAIDLLVRERRAAAQPQPVTSDTGGTVRVAQPAPHTSAAPRLASTAKPGVRVLYISPLKALGVDVQRNLRAPLAGIRRQAQLTGAPLPEISVGVRSGDTPPRERRRLAAHPPDILITTPESLYLMLTSRAAETLRGVHTVIVDEIHALADDKRGAHLALSLERLDLLLERPAQRIGLSATVRPVDAVARFLGGDRPVDVVAPPAHRRFDLTVEVPVDDMAHPPTPDAVADPSERAAAREPNSGEVSDADSAGEHRVGSMWPWIERSLLDRVLSVRSTIVFTNSRRLAERLTTRLNSLHAERLRADQGPERRSADRQRSSPERPDAPVSNAQTQDTQHTASPRTGTPTSGDQPSDAPAPLARAHHGSVSKEQRAEVEEALKTGRLRCVVATSSLELGIDMGQVDLVVQIDAPPSVASALQRVGRAGHQIDGVSRAVFYPTHRAQLLQTAIVTERMLAGELETLHLPANPLDVIAQQTIAQTAMGDLDVEAWYDTVRRAAPFRTLPRSAYESVLDLVSAATRRPSSPSCAPASSGIATTASSPPARAPSGSPSPAAARSPTAGSTGSWPSPATRARQAPASASSTRRWSTSPGWATCSPSAPPPGASARSPTTPSTSSPRSGSPGGCRSGAATAHPVRRSSAAPSARSPATCCPRPAPPLRPHQPPRSPRPATPRTRMPGATPPRSRRKTPARPTL